MTGPLIQKTNYNHENNTLDYVGRNDRQQPDRFRQRQAATPNAP
jgi:hypothetical protein